MTKKRISFILNPISGTVRKQGVLRTIRTMADTTLYDYEVLKTEYGGHATVLAEQAVANGADIVVAVGGDGTVNEVACAVAQSSAALGIIPCGSGNGLARHLMLPQEPRRAMGIINRGEVHTLDYGLINGRPFFCTCGMGFDAFVSETFAHSGRRGLPAYLESILREGLKYKPEHYVITADDCTITTDAFLVSCANASQYGNNAYIAPHASMADGFLDITIIKPFDVTQAPQLCIDILNKTLDKNPYVLTLRARNIDIERQSSGLIHYDGDPTADSAHLYINTMPQGIKMVVNPSADKSRRQPNLMQTTVNELLTELNSLRLLKPQDLIAELNNLRLPDFNNLRLPEFNNIRLPELNNLRLPELNNIRLPKNNLRLPKNNNQLGANINNNMLKLFKRKPRR